MNNMYVSLGIKQKNNKFIIENKIVLHVIKI
jgi:hypothetical protein